MNQEIYIGEEHRKPILDTRAYELESPDVIFDEYALTIIIENLIDQVDEQGWDTKILEEIVAFRHDSYVAIPTREQAYTNVNRIQLPIITKKGLNAQIKWRDQNTDWVPLHLIKE